MIEKPADTQVVKENCISMVQCKVMKQLEFIEQRKFDDEDIQAMRNALISLSLTKIYFKIQNLNFKLFLILIEGNQRFFTLFSLTICTVQEDIEFLKERMEASLTDLSSYDEYLTEVRSGRLEWSPVHRSERFWRENADKLNEKNYEMLRILIGLLQTRH